jgi:hypothetical protein
MAHLSTRDAIFQRTVETWLGERGEVSALIQYSAAAGNKGFEFFTSMPSFSSRMAELAPRTCVTVFGDQQLPVRGFIDDTFISALLAHVPDGAEYLVAGLEIKHYGKCSWPDFSSGEGREELRAYLADHRGDLVAAGVYPPWEAGLDECVIWAIAPDPDGSVVAGSY